MLFHPAICRKNERRGELAGGEWEQEVDGEWYMDGDCFRNREIRGGSPIKEGEKEEGRERERERSRESCAGLRIDLRIVQYSLSRGDKDAH